MASPILTSIKTLRAWLGSEEPSKEALIELLEEEKADKKRITAIESLEGALALLEAMTSLSKSESESEPEPEPTEPEPEPAPTPPAAPLMVKVVPGPGSVKWKWADDLKSLHIHVLNEADREQYGDAMIVNLPVARCWPCPTPEGEGVVDIATCLKGGPPILDLDSIAAFRKTPGAWK